MKKLFGIVLSVMLFFMVQANAFGELTFDMSVFENNENYTVTFDEMDDTGEISIVNGGSVLGLPDEENSEDLVIGSLDIRIIEDLPPVVRFTIWLNGDDWAFIEKVILKPGETRYTFEAESDTDVLDGGEILEGVTLVLTDESINLLQDIANTEFGFVKFRLVGSSRDVDGEFMFDKEVMQQLFDDYVASGALENDFSDIKVVFPCEISQSGVK